LVFDIKLQQKPSPSAANRWRVSYRFAARQPASVASFALQNQRSPARKSILVF
jgi:hypothetical protein